MIHNKSYIFDLDPSSEHQNRAFDVEITGSVLNLEGQAAVKELLREGEARNTVRSYQGAMRYWQQWHLLRVGCPPKLPLPPDTVVQFIVDHAQRSTPGGLQTELTRELDEALVLAGVKAKVGPLALATLEHRLSVLARAHRQAGHVSPTQDASVRELMTSVRRVYARRGQSTNKKPALSREPLEALLSTCDDSLRGVRDRALLLFAWGSGGRRRSEVTAATIERLKKVGPLAYIYTMGVSKTNQEGREFAENEKPLMGRVALALETWLQRSGVLEGPIFRRVRRGEHIGEPLSDAAVRDIVVFRSAKAGLAQAYSAHSLRSGFVSEAAKQNMSLLEAMAMTGHRSVTTFQKYFRGDVREMKSAFLLDADATDRQSSHSAGRTADDGTQ